MDKFRNTPRFKIHEDAQDAEIFDSIQKEISVENTNEAKGMNNLSNWKPNGDAKKAEDMDNVSKLVPVEILTHTEKARELEIEAAVSNGETIKVGEPMNFGAPMSFEEPLKLEESMKLGEAMKFVEAMKPGEIVDILEEGKPLDTPSATTDVKIPLDTETMSNIDPKVDIHATFQGVTAPEPICKICADSISDKRFPPIDSYYPPISVCTDTNKHMIPMLVHATYEVSKPSHDSSHELILVGPTVSFYELQLKLRHIFIKSTSYANGENICWIDRNRAKKQGATDLKQVCVDWKGSGLKGTTTIVHEGNITAVLRMLSDRRGEETLEVTFGEDSDDEGNEDL